MKDTTLQAQKIRFGIDKKVVLKKGMSA